MAESGDNTEIVKMMRNFKNAVHKPSTPSSLHPNVLSYNLKTSRLRPADSSNTPHFAGRLSFTNLDESVINHSSYGILSDEVESSDELKRKLATTEVELQVSRAALKEKESMISMIEPANKKICLSLEQQLEESRRKSEMDQEKIIQLTNKLKYAQSEALLSRSKIRECENERKIANDKLMMKYLASQREFSNMKLEYSELKSENAEKVGKLNNEVGRLELKINNIKEECKLKTEVIQSLQKQVEQLTEKVEESTGLREEVNELQIHVKTLENKIAAQEDGALIVQSMQSELKMLPEIRKENQILKEEIRKYKDSNVALFQEKMWAYQEKLAQAEKKNVTLAKLQVENETLKSKMAEWDALCDDDQSDCARSPASFSRKLSKYQKNEVLLTNQVTTLSARCETLEKKNESLEDTVRTLKKDVVQAQRNAGELEPTVKKLEKKIYLLTKERDNCRKLIDSYVKETSMTGAGLNSQHIKNLEETIAEYKQSAEKSAEEVESLEKEVRELTSANKLLTSCAGRTKICTFNPLFSGNRYSKSTMYDSKLQKEYMVRSSQNQKIIHYKQNPLDAAVEKKAADFKQVQDENDHLRKRVQVLEEGCPESDITSIVAKKLREEGSHTTLQGLKEKLASVERRNTLIIDTARTKAQEFRDAVYSLTGFRVDAPRPGIYKLSSVYAESRDDYLMFEVNQQGVKLLESEYSKQLGGSIDTYLKTYDSVPAFLASVQMNLFKQQTCMLSQSSDSAA